MRSEEDLRLMRKVVMSEIDNGIAAGNHPTECIAMLLALTWAIGDDPFVALADQNDVVCTKVKKGVEILELALRTEKGEQ